ncbi:MAG: Abi family protein [Puniceicoccales bacterium]|jgi:abortive infection bacteriophage resistance protein|nr:Abi family protein [Puniceicoccales bacterium]
MVTQYDKPFLSVEEQLALLVSRGMQVDDTNEAKHYLRHEGYYRLSSYFHPFRKIGKDGKRIDEFVAQANFTNVIQLYEFDKWLRTIMLSALRAVEISVRVAVAHHLGEKDIFAHENPHCLNGNFISQESDRRGKTWYEVWVDKYHHLLSRNDQEDFVRQFIEKYGQRIPIWVAIELWDFGLLSRFYGGMKFNDQQVVSRLYGVEEPYLFASWLRNFNYVRNVCAHHCRLWNRNIVEQPRLPQKNMIPDLRHLTERGVKSPGSRVYTTLALTTYVLEHMHYHGLWKQSVETLFDKFPICKSVSLDMVGVPQDWKQLTLWKQLT